MPRYFTKPHLVRPATYFIVIFFCFYFNLWENLKTCSSRFLVVFTCLSLFYFEIFFFLKACFLDTLDPELLQIPTVAFNRRNSINYDDRIL